MSDLVWDLDGEQTITTPRKIKELAIEIIIKKRMGLCMRRNSSKSSSIILRKKKKAWLKPHQHKLQ